MPWDRYVIPTRLKLTDYQLFSSSTTYTLPATHKFAIAEVICAGGGGTNGYSLYTAATGGYFVKPAIYTAMGGSGGGGGSFSRFWFPTDNSLTIVLTVGAGGAGTASQSGNQGGQTKLSLYDTVTTQTTTYILPGGTAISGQGGLQVSQYGNSPSNLQINQGGAPSTSAVPGEKSHFGGGAGGTGFMYGLSDASAGGSSENTRTAAAGNETNLNYLTGGGGAGAGASAAAGGNGSLAGSGGGGGGNGTGGTTGLAGGNGVYPGGGGGGGGPRSWANAGVNYYPTAAGGTGGGAQIKLWIYG